MRRSARLRELLGGHCALLDHAERKKNDPIAAIAMAPPPAAIPPIAGVESFVEDGWGSGSGSEDDVVEKVGLGVALGVVVVVIEPAEPGLLTVT